jgi:hypothetical protein
MAVQKRKQHNVAKKHTKKPTGKVSARGVADATVSGERSVSVHRKLDLKKRAQKLREWQEHMEAARLECVRLGIGAVKYLSDKNNIPQLPDCPLTWKDKTRLAHNIKIGRTPRKGEHMQHLTDAEELDVAIEMVRAAHDRNPRTWRAMEEVVAETISNRSNGPGGRVFVRPGRQGGICARKGRAGFKWRHAFAGRVGMKDFAAEDLGQSRARACNEHAMKEHLTDLRAELIDCGIMTAENSCIVDCRRIINMDEIPQVMNARANAGNAKERVGGGGHQQRVYQQAGEGRTCNTVEVCYDLGGYMYGPHVLLARTTLDTNVIDETALRREYHFDNTVDERMGMSWRFDLTTCECGIQTQLTLANRVASLREQIVARNTACVIAGIEPIVFPIVMLLDNHSSRFGANVHEALYFVDGDTSYSAGNWRVTPRGDIVVPYASDDSDEDDSDYDPQDVSYVPEAVQAKFKRAPSASVDYADNLGQQVLRMFSEPPNTSTFLLAIYHKVKKFYTPYAKRKVSNTHTN